MRVIQQGDKVRVHYVKRFEGGSVVTSRGKAPAELTVGVDHPRLPGLGLALVGLGVGESRTLVVPAPQAYGPYEPGRVRRLARSRLAEHEPLAVGEWVGVRGRRGRRCTVRIVEVREDRVVVDVNHRWAGQSVELELEVLGIDGPGTSSGSDTRGPSVDQDGGRAAGGDLGG